jgi:hypothetical protein
VRRPARGYIHLNYCCPGHTDAKFAQQPPFGSAAALFVLHARSQQHTYAPLGAPCGTRHCPQMDASHELAPPAPAGVVDPYGEETDGVNDGVSPPPAMTPPPASVVVVMPPAMPPAPKPGKPTEPTPPTAPSVGVNPGVMAAGA